MALSKNLKTFLTQFEYKALPKIKDGKSFAIFVSEATLDDEHVKELLGITNGRHDGVFMGVTIKGKPDMDIEIYD